MASKGESKVIHPDIPIPESGEIVKIAEGVYWLRMPLPMQLDHINLYLLEDIDGWYVVDTGIGTAKVESLWEQVFDHLGEKPIKGIIVTHMHPDHIGQAGYLSKRWNATLFMSRTEYFIGRTFAAGPSSADKWTEVDYYRKSGLSEDEIEELLAPSSSGYSKVVTPVPTGYARLEDGDTLSIFNRNWAVKVGSGHSPEHVCLYCEEANLLISGDHILPDISPNVGVYSTEPDANPLQQYLTTLKPFAELPDDTLVLPAHKRPFFGVEARVNELLMHHEHVLSVLLDACQSGKSAISLIPTIFKRELTGHHRFFALAECIAHLNYLVQDGKMNRQLDGVQFVYTSIVAGDAHALDNDDMEVMEV